MFAHHMHSVSKYAGSMAYVRSSYAQCVELYRLNGICSLIICTVCQIMYRFNGICSLIICTVCPSMQVQWHMFAHHMHSVSNNIGSMAYVRSSYAQCVKLYRFNGICSLIICTVCQIIQVQWHMFAHHMHSVSNYTGSMAYVRSSYAQCVKLYRFNGICSLIICTVCQIIQVQWHMFAHHMHSVSNYTGSMAYVRVHGCVLKRAPNEWCNCLTQITLCRTVYQPEVKTSRS